MGLRHFFWGAALAAALSATLVAQQAPVGYHSISCVRVKPGQSAAFRTLLNGDYHKVEQASVDSGRISGFIALRTVIPAGTDAGCDYVLVAFYPGFPPAPLGDDEMTAVLQKAGVTSTLPEWRDRLNRGRVGRKAKGGQQGGRIAVGRGVVIEPADRRLERGRAKTARTPKPQQASAHIGLANVRAGAGHEKRRHGCVRLC